MARPCRFCESPNRQRLETALLRREITQKEVAGELGVSRQRISDHINKHIPKAVRLAISQGKATAAGTKVTEQLVEINLESRAILDKALEAKDPGLALRAIDRVERQLRLQVKLLGDIPGGVTVNVLQSPQWISLRTIVFEVLKDYPEAREKLAERLRNELEDRGQ